MERISLNRFLLKKNSMSVYRLDKLLSLKKAKSDLERLYDNIDNGYKVPSFNKTLCENIIITINDVWQKENEEIKILTSCEEEEVLKVVTEEEEQTENFQKEKEVGSLKLKSPEAE